MAYADNFRLADDLVAHFQTGVSNIKDPFLLSRYAGFFSVTAVTVYELCIKEIFCSFSTSKHKVLGVFARSHFDRINGRIAYKILHEDYIPRYGEKYVKRFKSKVKEAEKQMLSTHRVSLINAYNNLIVWRNEFAHEGKIPANATLSDVISSYETGKMMLACLDKSMSR